MADENQARHVSEAGDGASLASGSSTKDPEPRKIPPESYYATIMMKYDTSDLLIGQLFQPTGMPNDAALVGVGHFRQVKDGYPSGAYEFPCIRCGRVFVDEYFKVMHDESCPPQKVELRDGVDVDLTDKPEVASAIIQKIGEVS